MLRQTLMNLMPAIEMSFRKARYICDIKLINYKLIEIISNYLNYYYVTVNETCN